MGASSGSQEISGTPALPVTQHAMRTQAWLLPTQSTVDDRMDPALQHNLGFYHQLTSLLSTSPGASRDCCSHTTVFFPGVLGVSISRLLADSTREVEAVALLAAAAVDTLRRVDSVRVRVFLCIWS